MTLDDELAEQLKKRYDFATWRDPSRSVGDALILGFFFTGQELSDWRTERFDRISSAAEARLTSFWARPEGPRDEVLRIDAFESVSTEAADEQLLGLLGEFQAGALERRVGIGEIAFGFGASALLFRRANQVFLVRNAGPRVVGVAEAGGQIDSWLLGRRTSEGAAAERPQIAVVRKATEAQIGVPIGLDYEIRDPRDREVWSSVATPAGRLRLAEGKPQYVPTATGAAEVTIVATNAAGFSASEILRLSIGESGSSRT
jgi:hypothetical protein